jgi:hypothetical protein
MPNPALLICFSRPMHSKNCWHQACLPARGRDKRCRPSAFSLLGPPAASASKGAGAIDASPSHAGGMKLACPGQHVLVHLRLEVERTLGVDLAVRATRTSGSATARAIAAEARPRARTHHLTIPVSRFVWVVGSTRVYGNCLGKYQVQFVRDPLGICFTALRVGALAPDMRMRLVTGSRQALDQ